MMAQVWSADAESDLPIPIVSSWTATGKSESTVNETEPVGTFGKNGVADLAYQRAEQDRLVIVERSAAGEQRQLIGSEGLRRRGC